MFFGVARWSILTVRNVANSEMGEGIDRAFSLLVYAL